MLLTNTLQQDTLPAYVELYELDATIIGGTIHRFTNSTPLSGNVIAFGGYDYVLIPIEFTGLTQKSDGSQPRPQMSISNVGRILLSSVISLGDLVGAKLRRIRTFEKYLDNAEDPNPNAYIEDVFYISQKTSHSSSQITFELCTALELTELKVPGRQVLKKDFPAVGGSNYRG